MSFMLFCNCLKVRGSIWAWLLPGILCLASYPLNGREVFKSLPLIRSSGLKDTALANAIMETYKQYYVVCIDSLPAGKTFLENAYHIYLKNKNYKAVADVTSYLGSSASVAQDYGKALEYSFLSLKYAELSSDLAQSGRAYRNIGLIYYIQRRWTEALKYFEKSITLINSDPKKTRLSVPLYLSGLCLIELHRCSEAVSFIEQARKIAVVEKDTLRIHECKVAEARALHCNGNTKTARELLNQTVDFYKKENEFNALSSIFLEFARIDLKENNPESAMKYALQAYEFDKISNLRLYRIDITKILSQLYRNEGNTAEALKFAEEYNNVRDSLISRDLIAEIAVTQARYEFKKTEDRINLELRKNEAKKRRANIVILLFSVVLAAGSIAFYSVRKERKKSDALLLNILPRKTADELKQHGEALPKSHPAVTIMFCDVESFTKISEQLSAETIVNMLNFYFGGFDKIIGEMKIEKIKTIGDAYMCVLGLQNEKDHAVRMVSAALKFQEFLNSTKDDIIHRYGLYLNFRIGINSGPVVSGVVGSKKYAYDIWGDAVNIAARMEQTSIPGKINISENTYNLVSKHFSTTYRGEISAKNKGQMKMYFVESESPVA